MFKRKLGAGNVGLMGHVVEINVIKRPGDAIFSTGKNMTLNEKHQCLVEPCTVVTLQFKKKVGCRL